MADYVSNSGFQGGGTNTGQNFNFAMGTQTNPCVVIAVMFGDSSASVSSVTVGGVAATFLRRIPTPNGGETVAIEVWYATGTTAQGTKAIVTSHGSAEAWCLAVLASNVDQSNPVRDSDALRDVIEAAEGIAAPAVDSAVGDLVLSFATCNSESLSPAQTNIVNELNSDFHGASRTAGSAGTVTMNWTSAGIPQSEAAIIALSLQSPSASSTTITPTQAVQTLNGRQPSHNAFNFVRIREVLINESGQPVVSAANIRLLVWYSGQCIGAPDVSLNGQTTDANGTTSWSIATGTLTSGATIFYVAQDSISFSNYTAARMVPSYEIS
jgi:hypothetical protein